MGLTSLGILHTVIGVLAIGAAIVSYARYGKINLDKKSGLVYFYATLITSLTALGVSKLGGFNPGHFVALLIVFLVTGAFVLHKRIPGRKRARYFENFAMALSLFLSLIPTIVETLTRIPVGQPLAKSINDPIIQKSLGIVAILFVLGSISQIAIQWRVNLKYRSR
jgi:hypothetical protein